MIHSKGHERVDTDSVEIISIFLLFIECLNNHLQQKLRGIIVKRKATLFLLTVVNA
jgi:hypothetical protein